MSGQFEDHEDSSEMEDSQGKTGRDGEKPVLVSTWTLILWKYANRVDCCRTGVLSADRLSVPSPRIVGLSTGGVVESTSTYGK